MARVVAFDGRAASEDDAQPEANVHVATNLSGMEMVNTYGFQEVSGTLNGMGVALLRAALARPFPVICLIPTVSISRSERDVTVHVINLLQPMESALSRSTIIEPSKLSPPPIRGSNC
jgi:predicted ATP-grasp superfamily ATP-dependent carboligase